MAIAIKYAQEALLIARRTSQNNHEFLALNRLANAYLINDDYDLALRYGLDAEQIAEKLGSHVFLALVNSTLGWLYYDVRDAKQALHFHTKALQYSKQTPDSLATCVNYNAVGLTYLLSKDFEHALPFLHKALTMGKMLRSNERILAAMNNIGDALAMAGKYDEAMQWLDQAIPFAEKHPDALRMAELQNSHASVLLAMGRLQDALTASRLAEQFSTQSHSNARIEVSMQNALVRTSIFKKMKSYDSALQAFELHNALHEQILSDVKKNDLLNSRATWESEKNQDEILKLEGERKLRTNQRNAIAVGIILLTVIGFVAYSRERQLRLKEHQLSETLQALTQVELEKSELERKALADKLEFKNRELTNYALYISQRNELQRSFLEELEIVKANTSTEHVHQLNRVIKQFSVKEEVNKEAEEFHVNVELENKDFFYNLTQKFPELTENEKRLCAQVRLNLSIKDIASVNNISVKAVEMARYRLRKKMNIPHEDNLGDFLKRI